MPPIDRPGIPTHDRDDSTDIRRLVLSTDQNLTPQQVQEDISVNLNTVSQYLQTRIDDYKNAREQSLLGRQRNSKNFRIVSDVGLQDAFRSAGNFDLGASPGSRWIPARLIDTTRREPNGQPVRFVQGVTNFEVRAVVLHSFGGALDKGILSNNRTASEITSEPDTNFNPRRFFNGVETLSSDRSASAVHNIISRRGDLVNSVSWDDKARHGGGDSPGHPAVTRSKGFDLNAMSLGIELEEHYVRFTANPRFSQLNFTSIDGIRNKAPYTEQQLVVIAFLLKKLQNYTNNVFEIKHLGWALWADLMDPGAPGRGTFPWADNLLAGNTGLMQHWYNNFGHSDPRGQFDVPPNFTIADASDISRLKQTYADDGWSVSTRFANLKKENIDYFYTARPRAGAGINTATPFAPNTDISGWSRLARYVSRIRDFNLATEVFDRNLAQLPIQVLNITRVTQGPGALRAAQVAGVGRTESVNRVSAMQTQARTNYYGQGEQNASVASNVYAQSANRIVQVTRNVAEAIVVQNGLAFDYSTGNWVASTMQENPNQQPTAVPTTEGAV